MKSRIKLSLAILIALVLLIPLSAAAGTVTLPNDIAWVMTADTYRMCCQQAYLNAINRLRVLAEGRKPGTWCVVLDADETIISNVQFQAEQAASGAGYSRDAWNAWCQRMEATAIPGAIEFLSAVRELGGKIIIVTNRQAPLHEPTVKNLEKIKIPFDLCLTREGAYKDDRSKVQRRSDIEKGTLKDLPLGKRMPALEILMLAGDQTHDLYEGKTYDEVKDRFGTNLIIVPNPMYGDWAGATFKVPAGAAPARRPVSARPAAEEEPAVSAPPRARSGESAITWQEAMDRVGQTVTVEAQIVSVYDPAERGRTGPVKLNTDRDWKTSLTIILFNKDGQFGDPSRFDGKTVRAKGKVSIYQDSVQLSVFGPDTIEIVD
jgi:5'-nucleotidase (lipoprotein e(P4) family)